jgi:hypothetical protein
MLKIKITPDSLNNLTWEQWETFENTSEKPNYRKLREIVSIFVDGMNKDEAMIALGKLTTPEMKNVFEQISEKMKEITDVNPTNGDV